MARELFSKKPVVVLKRGKVVERYDSLFELWQQYPDCSLPNMGKRVKARLDGWLPDDKKARFVEDEKKRGKKLNKSKAHEKEPKKLTPMQEVRRSQLAIEELYRRYDAGEIGIEERQREIGWHQNHIKVMQQRMKNRQKKEEQV